MNFNGIIIAAACFVSIGIFHPIVVKAEYYFSKKCWPVFLAAGLALLFLSMKAQSIVGSAILGSVGCSSLWSIGELFHQEKRVEKGWFPKNPKRRLR